MVEESNYNVLTEECGRWLLMAKISENSSDKWVWALLGKSWLTLIDARRGAEEEPPPSPNISILTARAALASYLTPPKPQSVGLDDRINILPTETED
jgi:hypothetical protein